MKGLAEGSSLLDFLEAPVVVSDPDGRAVFLNPSFETRFDVSREGAIGEPLAALFEGGNREAVLAAVASACARGQTQRFRMRERGVGYLAVASPIVAEGERIGAVLLLGAEPMECDGLRALQRDLSESVERVSEFVSRLDEPHESEDLPQLLAEVRPALAQARRVAGGLLRIAAGESREQSQSECADPTVVVRDAVAGVAREVTASGVGLDVLVPQGLPLVPGDPKRLQEVLESWLRARLARRPAPSALTLSARSGPREASVVIRLIEDPAPSEAPTDPPLLREAVTELGGRIESHRDPHDGHVTSVSLPIAE